MIVEKRQNNDRLLHSHAVNAYTVNKYQELSSFIEILYLYLYAQTIQPVDSNFDIESYTLLSFSLFLFLFPIEFVTPMQY